MSGTNPIVGEDGTGGASIAGTLAVDAATKTLGGSGDVSTQGTLYVKERERERERGREKRKREREREEREGEREGGREKGNERMRAGFSIHIRER